ncbi:MAG: hypothetical protein H8D65_03140, partial [Spirochaetes bacterium]|nr:hypothetical protein [Spirochaetota bacterium]
MGSNAAATLLTQDVLTYQKSENNRNYILNKIYIFIYQYPVARGYIEEEIASDFLLFLVPKLERIIKRYTYTGVSFEVYLRNIIFWQIKTFTQLRKEAQIKEEVFTKYFYNCVEKISFYDKEPDSFNNISVCDYAHSYSGDTSSPYVNLIKSPKGRKKILIIALIHADIINNSLISGV